jgi:rSAM/selenodomain-associated transferase 1
MARLPTPGLCKTRLCPPLSEEQAAGLYRAFVTDVGRELAGWSAAADTWVAWSGDADEPGELRGLFDEGTRFLRQQGESLSERMSAVFEHLFERGYQRVVMRNSDSPHLPLSFLDQAFAALQEIPGGVVLGPDLDGGYYLVGLDRPAAGIFPDAMSTGSVFQQTLAAASEQNRRVAELPAFLDVDDADDLCTFWLEFGGRADVRHWATWQFIEEHGLVDRVVE